MFKSKAHKASKSANPQGIEWEILTGKENIGRRDNVDLPPQGVLVKETPWAPSNRTASGQKDRIPSRSRNRPRTSSLPEIDSPQQQQPTQHVDRSTDAIEKHAMNRAFEKMLDELQIPPATRSKLATLDTPVKAAMLKSSHVLNIDVPLTPPSIGAANSPLRKTRSSASINLDRPEASRSKSAFTDIPYEPRPPSSLGAAAVPSPLDDESVINRGSAPWMRDEYAGSASSLNRPTSPIPASLSASSTLSSARPASGSKDKLTKEKEKDKNLSPEAFANMLSKTVCTSLEVERLKKLRLMLRNESAG